MTARVMLLPESPALRLNEAHKLAEFYFATTAMRSRFCGPLLTRVLHSAPQDREARHRLPQTVPRILHVLLDLPILPARRRIAEHRLEHIMVRHRKEAHVDLSLLPTTDAVDRSAHVIVDPGLRDAGKDTESVPVGIEQHLVRLQQIGPNQKGTAVRQLDVGDLKLGALAAQNGKILAPIKLEGLARAKRQGREGAAPRRLLLPLAINPPVMRKSRDPAVGPIKVESHQLGM
jgi:hypothetical protein